MAYFPQKQIDRLTESNAEVLRALSRYRYLTSSQMVQLGIASYRTGIYKLMARFEVFTKPVLGVSNFSRVHSDRAGRQKLESFYHLTERGADLLEVLDPDFDEELRHVKARAVAERDYDHRRETVDFHILVDQFAAMYGCEVDCFHVYFDHTGSNHNKSGMDLLRRNTTVEFDLTDEATGAVIGSKKFSPDAIFHLTDPTGTGHLFSVEIQRGMDTKRLHTKLRDEYIPALGEGALSLSYGVRYPAKVLVICENPALMEHTLERINADPEFEGFEDSFAFHTVEALCEPHPSAQDQKRVQITEEARRGIAEALNGNQQWQQAIMNDDELGNEPKRLATGWHFMGRKVGGIF